MRQTCQSETCGGKGKRGRAADRGGGIKRGREEGEGLLKEEKDS